MMNQPLVSAIITTYKRSPSMLLRALDSVLMQSYKNIEVIVVDDSPSDFLERPNVKVAVLERQVKYPDISIHYIAHKKNMGACVARNTGLEASKGEFIAYLDDDDEWLPNKIEKQVNAIQKSNAALVYCGRFCVNDDKGSFEESPKVYYKGDVFKKLLYFNFIESTSYPIIRKTCLQKIGGFDPKMQSAQDYDVWLRIAKYYKVDYIKEPLVLYHVHAGERITSNPSKKIQGLERLNRKYVKYLNADRRLWWKRNINLSLLYAIKGDGRKAFNLWKKCIIKYPENIKLNTIYFFRILRSITSARSQ